ncbi:MAG: hypothetical protein QXO70_03855 [Candidatus Pacearchaeota archaeon]
MANNSNTYSDKLRELDSRRKRALGSQNPLEYYFLCDELGVAPEDDSLYGLGKAEFNALMQRESKLEKELNRMAEEARRNDIKNFLKEAGRLDVSYFSDDAECKKELLAEYFPRRFGPNGKQNLDSYSDVQIGVIFANVVETYRKQIRKNKF